MKAPYRGHYRFQRVYGQTTLELRAEIIEFWRHEQALPASDDGQARSRQVFYLARNAENEIVGLCSIYVADFLQAGNPHYFYRMFVRPRDRRLTVTVSLWRLTSEALAAEYRPGAPKGLVLVTENPKLWQRGGRRWIAAGGYRNVGKDARGCEVWLKSFVETQQA